MIYYNDNDAKCCAWLRELIAAKLITEGEVDETSITEIVSARLEKAHQAHFFAGIGGWAYALTLAGWPQDREVWTGSCPCQSFSVAGKRRGVKDARHLWPAWFRLIRQCRPATIFGEQVEGAIGHGWLDAVFADLEGEGYACGAAVLGAHSVSAPHRRQRIFWVGHAQGRARKVSVCARGSRQAVPEFGGAGGSCGLAHGQRKGLEKREVEFAWEKCPTVERGGDVDWAAAEWIICKDAAIRYLPAQPIFQFTFDGISSIMGSGWDAFVFAVKERILKYATKTKSGPGEILRAVWYSFAKETLRRRIGGYDAVCGSEVLLIALCQLAGGVGGVCDCSTQDFRDISENTLRILWGQAVGAFAACASYQRRLAGSPRRKFKNSLYQVSSQESAQEACSGMHSLFRGGKKVRNVSEALSAIQEVWRSLGAKDSTRRHVARFCAGAETVVACGCFPLAHSIPGRGMLIRGAGNAIVPQLAAEFIGAFLEAEHD